MQVTNYPSAEDLGRLKSENIADLPAEVLADLQEQIFLQADQVKRRLSILDGALSIKYADQTKQAYRDKGQDTGRAHFVDGGIGVEIDTPKNVSWDQEKLMKALNNMAPDQAKHYAKMKVEVPENKFSSAPPDIKEILAPLRTVKPGKMKIRFEHEER